MVRKGVVLHVVVAVWMQWHVSGNMYIGHVSSHVQQGMSWHQAESTCLLQVRLTRLGGAQSVRRATGLRLGCSEHIEAVSAR